MISPSPSGSGFTLARLPLRSEQDLVSLARRTRAASEDLGLHPRHVARLSAATYEAARLLMRASSFDAEIRLTEGPSLQVVLAVPAVDEEQRSTIRNRAESDLEQLRPMVDGLQVHENGLTVCVFIRVELPIGGDDGRDARSGAPDGTRAAALPGEDIPSPELRHRHEELRTAFHELQLELQETNRGVVALHAELEAQAESLRHAEDRLRLLLDSVQDYAICMLSPDGEIASWNVGAERLFGYAADEIIGRNVECFYPPTERDLGIPAEHLRLAGERGRFACESLRVRHGGAHFDAHVVLTPVRRGRERELHGFSLVVRDVTERKRLEDDLRRRAEELADANRAKEVFLATLSHELRTPLNAMLGWTRLLRMGRLDAAAASRALETIERNARIQEQLISDMLDVSRIVTGKLRLNLRPVDVAPVIDAALDAVRPAAEAKGVALVAGTSFDGVVLGDADRLQQVVWNLLVNAIKFTPAGGRVTVKAGREDSGAVLTVSDTGEGIAPELLPYIFDRFTQGDASFSRPHGGLGLGLSIVRHIVELHGGTVDAQSAGKGQGATFSVHLPTGALRPVTAGEPSEPQR